MPASSALHRPAVSVAAAAEVRRGRFRPSTCSMLNGHQDRPTAPSTDGSAGIGRPTGAESHGGTVLERQLRGNGVSGICRDVIPLERGRELHTERQSVG